MCFYYSLQYSHEAKRNGKRIILLQQTDSHLYDTDRRGSKVIWHSLITVMHHFQAEFYQDNLRAKYSFTYYLMGFDMKVLFYVPAQQTPIFITNYHTSDTKRIS